MEPACLLDFRKGTVESGMPVFDFFYWFVNKFVRGSAAGRKQWSARNILTPVLSDVVGPMDEASAILLYETCYDRLPEEKIMVTWIQFGVTPFRNKGTLKWGQSGQERGSANINCCTKLLRQAGRLTVTTVGSGKYYDKPVRIIQNLTTGKAAMRSVLQAVMMVQHTTSPWEVSMVRAAKACP